MPENKKNLKNHQMLEICGVEIFKKIQRKKIIRDTQKESMDSLNQKSSDDKK